MNETHKLYYDANVKWLLLKRTQLFVMNRLWVVNVECLLGRNHYSMSMHLYDIESQNDYHWDDKF